MKFIQQLLSEIGVASPLSVYIANVVIMIAIAALCILANFIAKTVVLNVLSHYIRGNKYKWDNVILERRVFQKLSHVVPAIILYYFSSTFPIYQGLIIKGVIAYVIVIGVLVLDALLNAVNDIYITYEVSKVRPIRGYIQVIKIFVYTIGIVLVIAALLGENPVILLSGIGALSAVLLLVFKDSLLGLVAGIQLASNDMVRVGDWIEMPKYGADGDIIDISLHTVKVRNWDKTITTVPSYALISDSFKNWRGMQEIGGRRIKRSIYVDTSSIAFCTEDQIEAFKRIHYLTEYIEQKLLEIDEHNLANHIDKSNKVNGRALTNIGVFRAYVLNYLKNHPRIHKGMTLLVRQLAPGEHGLPLEIYAFTNDTRWAVYEDAQSDIFDHILAVAPEFGLRVFQNPTGYDLKTMLQVPETDLQALPDKLLQRS